MELISDREENFEKILDENRDNTTLPLLFVSGTHYEVGYNIGTFFAPCIKLFCSKYTLLQNIVLPFYNSKTGRDMYDQYLKICQEGFPQYVEEIKGLSDGSGVSFDQLFVYNCLNEMVTLSNNYEGSYHDKGCTDVFVNQPELKFLAHNEDNHPLNDPYLYMIAARINDPTYSGRARSECITAFCYPGMLPGGTFSFNNHGMIFTGDALFPNFAIPGKTPRTFLGRSLITTASINESCQFFDENTYGSSFGYCFNIASTKEIKDMWSIEVAPSKERVRYHLHTIAPQTNPLSCHYYHFNSYKHLQVEQLSSVLTGSPAWRMKRTSEMKPPNDLTGIKNILGDTHYDNYPLFRSPNKDDNSQTLATVIFDIINQKVKIYRENVKHCQKPFFTLPLNLMQL